MQSTAYKWAFHEHFWWAKTKRSCYVHICCIMNIYVCTYAHISAYIPGQDTFPEQQQNTQISLTDEQISKYKLKMGFSLTFLVGQN